MRTSALSQDEIDRLVVSQANDPEAWGVVVNARPFGVSQNLLASEDNCLYTTTVFRSSGILRKRPLTCSYMGPDSRRRLQSLKMVWL